MELVLSRTKNGTHACLGDLSIDGAYSCHTLEDVVRDLKANGSGKVPHETAIPAGRYRVTVEMSPKFGKLFPRLHNVQWFDGILIHPGNTDEDTWGCILTGDDLQGETIKRGTARPAFSRVFDAIQDAIKSGEEVWIDVKNDFPEPLKEVA